MSDPAVTAYLTKLLCSHGGRLERFRLAELLNLADEQIEQILRDEPRRFPQSSHLVLAQTPLRICTVYLRPGGEEDEERCPKLHLCRHYLRDQCPPNRRPRCRFSHDVMSDHNRAVLKANEVSGLNEDEIKVLLFQNDNQLLPEICQKYKQEDCDQGDDCTRLHVCSYFTHVGCNRRYCRKSHNLLDSRLLLTCSWLSANTIQNFQMLCVLKSIERQQAPREEGGNEKPRGARGMLRGRGRGRPGDRRRAGSQDLLDSRSRERRNEGSHIRWRSHSRPPSQCSVSQHSGDEGYNDSDSSSDHGRYPKTRLDNLMSDWFTPNASQEEKAQVRSSGGVKPQEGTRFVPPNKSSGMTSRFEKPLIRQTPDKPIESMNSRLTSELSRVSYNTHKADYGSSDAASVRPVPLLEYYQPYSQAALPSVQKKPEVSPRTEQSVYYPTSLTPPSRPTVTTLMSNLSVTSPKTSTISSTSFNPSREYPSTQSKSISASSSSLNRPVNLSTGESSSAETRVSPSLIVSNKTEIYSAKSPATPKQKADMQLDEALGSSLARLSYALPTAPKTSLYSTTGIDFTTRPTLATPKVSDHMGASSSSSLSDVSVIIDIPSSKLQASVKPIIKTEKTSGTQVSLLDADFNYFCHPPMAPSSKAAQPQSATAIPFVSPEKSSPDKTPEICLIHIWKHCILDGKCGNMHYNVPYRWQVLIATDWYDLPNMEDIEKAYSNPMIDRYQLIDFEAMKLDFKPVRRLTTPSSVTKPPEYVLTTEWCWYWKNESGTWTEYGQSNTENMNSTILSSDLETIYQSDPTGIIPFTAGNQDYFIDCLEMKQKNIYFKTEREVRRRPKFLKLEDVKMLRGR